MPSTYQKFFPTINSRQVTRFYNVSWAVAKTCRSWSWDIWDRQKSVGLRKLQSPPGMSRVSWLADWMCFLKHRSLVLLLRKSEAYLPCRGLESYQLVGVLSLWKKRERWKIRGSKESERWRNVHGPCCVFSRWCLRHVKFAARKTLSQRKVPAVRISSHMKSSKRKKAMKNWVMSVNCRTALPARGPAYTTAVFGSKCRRRLPVWSRRTKKGWFRCDLPSLHHSFFPKHAHHMFASFQVTWVYLFINIVFSFSFSCCCCRRIPRRWAKSGRSPWHGSAGKHERWAEEASEQTGARCVSKQGRTELRIIRKNMLQVIIVQTVAMNPDFWGELNVHEIELISRFLMFFCSRNGLVDLISRIIQYYPSSHIPGL